MKEESRACLYNAMEKGFVSYDKGGKHLKFDARISLIATANPIGDSFKSYNVVDIKKQLPFDTALMSRFHLIFFVKKPDENAFVEIAKKIVKNKKQETLDSDKDFLKMYINYANTIKNVEIPKQIESMIVNLASRMKEDEKNLLIEITPRLVVGITRLVKASARMSLRNKANKEDFEYSAEILKDAFRV